MKNEKFIYPPWIRAEILTNPKLSLKLSATNIINPLRVSLLRIPLVKYFFYIPKTHQPIYKLTVVTHKISSVPSLIIKVNSLLYSNYWRKFFEVIKIGQFKELTLDGFGGRLAASTAAEFSHWSSLTCLKFERKCSKNEPLLCRHLFATLCINKLLECLESPHQATRFLNEWVGYIIKEKRINQNRLNFLANKKVYPLLDRYIFSSNTKGDTADEELLNLYRKIILEYEQNIFTINKMMGRLSREKKRYKPLWEILGRIIHSHWLRLGIPLFEELIFEKALVKTRKQSLVS